MSVEKTAATRHEKHSWRVCQEDVLLNNMTDVKNTCILNILSGSNESDHPYACWLVGISFLGGPSKYDKGCTHCDISDVPSSPLRSWSRSCLRAYTYFSHVSLRILHDRLALVPTRIRKDLCSCNGEVCWSRKVISWAISTLILTHTTPRLPCRPSRDLIYRNQLQSKVANLILNTYQPTQASLDAFNVFYSSTQYMYAQKIFVCATS